MNSDSTVIEDIKRISGIGNLSKLSAAEATKLLNLIGEQRLSEAHVKALIEVAPQFISIANEALKTISKTVEGTKESQKNALSAVLAAVSGLTNVLTVLANKAESDEVREKIAQYLIEAGKLYIQVTIITKDMNKDNNDTWVKIAGISGTVVSIISGIAIFALQGNKK